MVRTIISVVLPKTKAEQGKIRHGHSRSTRLSDLTVVPLAGFTFVGTSKTTLNLFRNPWCDHSLPGGSAMDL